MITYCVILLFLALGQGSQIPANDKGYISQDNDAHEEDYMGYQDSDEDHGTYEAPQNTNQNNSANVTQQRRSRPPRSCQDIRSANRNLPSGYYMITDSRGQARTVYCNMGTLCGSSGGWTRVAYLNMRDPRQQCPSTLQLYRQGNIRACGRRPLFGGCKTVGSFSSYGVRYREVCGRIKGYQYWSPDGFGSTFVSNGVYAEGVGLTYGNPPKHIWTFAAGRYSNNCPCTAQRAIGYNYFCESGTIGVPKTITVPRRRIVVPIRGVRRRTIVLPKRTRGTLYTADPLWDGRSCYNQESSCCRGRFRPPWFRRVLPTYTSANIDMKTCFCCTDEDSPMELYEIYVK